ncbi:MAG: DUF2283 domain-containing protein [Candidatus Kapabacteria bacterium]|nr:DUF2283 domain-containing protein [Candidatus Kapabacteria bacterium]
MKIEYDDKFDLLYLKFDDSSQELINQRVSENIVLDIGTDNKIVGIEILDARESLNLNSILPINYSIITKEMRTIA